MNLIIKQAKIIDPQSKFHNQTQDLKIENGIISQIADSIENESGFEILQQDNLHVSIGWFDSSVSLGEPGFEDRETLSNGLQVAAQSGFTSIALQPNTSPSVDNQTIVEFINHKASNKLTNVYPIGNLTLEGKGQHLADLFDMKNAGAIAFGDYNKSIENPNVLKLALQYVQDFNGLVIAYSEDANLKGIGIANEGVTSTKLGMKGIPNLAEDIQVARNLFLLEYTGGKLHIPTISTAKSVELIKEAKAKGLQVTCSVSVHHLLFTDEKLFGFDTNYKINPPLRSQADKEALLKGVLDGTIDAITSDHNPLDVELKKLEFDKAKSGTIGLESAFGALNTLLPIEVIIEKLTAAYYIFGIEKPSIATQSKANITIFTTTDLYDFSINDIKSKSKNSAFIGTSLQGKVVGVVNNKKVIIN